MAESAPVRPHLGIERIYLRDLSFESPQAPGVFSSQWNPQIQVEVHARVDRLTESRFEVVLTLTLEAKSGESTVLVDPEDLEGARAALAGGEIACAILEPTGASTGMVPASAAFLEGLREATAEAGAAPIFDEVVTGFRVSPGGAQGHYGIRPDLTAFAKIVAGGLPGGCSIHFHKTMD